MSSEVKDVLELLRGHQREKHFRQMIVDLAKIYLWEVYFTADSRGSPEGFPDLVLCKPPRMIYAELKVGRRKTTYDQTRWLGKLEACPPNEVKIWRPEDWGDIQETLTK